MAIFGVDIGGVYGLARADTAFFAAERDFGGEDTVDTEQQLCVAFDADGDGKGLENDGIGGNYFSSGLATTLESSVDFGGVCSDISLGKYI